MSAIKICVALIVVTATLSTAQAPPIVVELQPAAAITAVDHQDISRLLEATPKPAWLWMTRRGLAGGIWLVQAFAAPDVERENLRRGSATMIRGEMSPADVAARNVTGPKSWVNGATVSYAQVVMPNRMFQDIRGPKDPNLPFVNSTTLTDDELVSLVTFLRTSPAGPSTAPERVFRGFPLDVRGDLPIDTVGATDGAIYARIRLAVSKMQIVRLSHAGTNWTIIEITGFVA